MEQDFVFGDLVTFGVPDPGLRDRHAGENVKTRVVQLTE